MLATGPDYGLGLHEGEHHGRLAALPLRVPRLLHRVGGGVAGGNKLAQKILDRGPGPAPRSPLLPLAQQELGIEGDGDPHLSRPPEGLGVLKGGGFCAVELPSHPLPAIAQHVLILLVLPLVRGRAPPDTERVARRRRVDLPLRGALPGPPEGERLAVQGAPLYLQIGPGQVQGPQQALHRAMRLCRGLHQDDGGDSLDRLTLLQLGGGNVPRLLRGRTQDEELLERGPLVRDGPL